MEKEEERPVPRAEEETFCLFLLLRRSGEKLKKKKEKKAPDFFFLGTRKARRERERESTRARVVLEMVDIKEEEEEENQTPAEREAWLRAHGVEIETAEDRLRMENEAKRLREKEKSEPTRKLVCVKIPAEDSLPFEEVILEVPMTKPGDVFPDLVKPYFIGGGDIDVNLAKQAATKQLGEEFASKSQNLGVSLAKETAMGSTETFALVRPSEKNGRKGVYIYLDEVGLLKGKPKNARASSLAASCGFPGTTFHGDVFVGAVQTEPQPMRSVDFTVKEMDSSAAWLKLAPMENAEYAMSMKELEKAMSEKGVGGGPGLQRINMGGGGGNDDGVLPSGDGEGYRWEQNEDGEVEISVYVPENTSAKTISVGFRADSCVVSNKSEGKVIVQIDNLYNKIRPDECTWTIAGGSKKNEVCVSLTKVNDDETWPALTK